MNKIWEFFENMDEMVYVSDVESYELVYMNQKALDIYGIKSFKEVAGKPCHEVLQNCSTPCHLCNNHELKQGSFKEWLCFNPILDKQMMLKDTVVEEDGKTYRMEIAIDPGRQESRVSMQRSYENLEATINEGLRMALMQKTPSKTLEVLLEYMGKALGGERTYIFEKNEKGNDDNTYEWVASGVSPEKENLQDLPPEICANWYENFSIGKHIVIKELADIQEKDPLQYDILKRQNIHSLVVVPLYDDGEAIGFYGVDNPPKKSLAYASNMLQIMAHFIISSLRRRNLIRRLRDMSYRDQLTKIGNRHAMNEFIEQIKQENCLGIVYCDVTGLKRVNDSEGHEAGDRLIINSCGSLKQAFGDYGLFRIGGDELLAICTGMDEKDLWERTDQLKEDLKDKEIHMAVGAVWEKDSLSGIDKLISEAEKRMYQDKAEYYRSCGIERRKEI